MTRQYNKFRVLICEDEYLLASDLATELEERGATVVAIMARIAEVDQVLQDQGFTANAAVLDVKLLDGMVFELVGRLQARGVAVVFCTGYGTQDLPPEFRHLPLIGKPTDIDELFAALEKAELPPVSDNENFAHEHPIYREE